MSKSRFQSLFMLFLITIFIAGSGLIVLYGASFYSEMSAKAEKDLQVRSATLYFNHRFKQGDVQGGLWLSIQDNQPVLIFDAGGYFILVYEEDGALVEQVSDNAVIMEGAGQAIAALSQLDFELTHNTAIIRFTDGEGLRHQLNYTLLTLGVRP